MREAMCRIGSIAERLGCKAVAARRQSDVQLSVDSQRPLMAQSGTVGHAVKLEIGVRPTKSCSRPKHHKTPPAISLGAFCVYAPTLS